jgi:hypothetical protein
LKDNISFLEDSIEMYKNLFPNKQLYTEIVCFNMQVNSKVFRANIKWMLLIIVIVVIAMVSLGNEKYLFINLMFYMVLIFMSLNTYVLFRQRSKIFKKQYLELLNNRNQFSIEISLHNNYKKYRLKWNFIYAIIILFSSFMSLSLFISDIIEKGNTSLGPIVVLLISLLILLIPTITINMFSFKKFRKKQRLLESKICLD